MPIRIRNITPRFTGTVRIGVTVLGPEWLSSTALAGHETMPVDFALLTDKPSTFSLVSGSLPQGVTLNTTSGRIQGVLPIVSAMGSTHDVVLRATDANGKIKEAPLRVSVEGAAEGDLYDFPANHTLHATYLPVTGDYLATQYPRLVSKFGTRIVTTPAKPTSYVSNINFGNSNSTAGFGNYGVSVAVSASKNVMAVGNPFVTYPGNIEGNVTLFRHNGSNWGTIGPINQPNETYGKFGAKVALNVDGSVMVVRSSGRAKLHVYRLESGSYNLKSTISNPGVNANNSFGNALQISPDGQTIVASDTSVGNAADDGLNIGRVYVFTTTNFTSWTTTVIDSTTRTAGDWFGSSVELNSGNDTLLVSKRLTNNRGQLLVYKKTNGSWTLHSSLAPNNLVDNNLFGANLSVTADGAEFVVGTNISSSSIRPLVYHYKLNGAVYELIGQLQSPDTKINTEFGRALALSASADRLLVGSPLADATGGTGTVIQYVRNGNTWTQELRVAPTSSAPSRFGAFVAFGRTANNLVVHENTGNGAVHELQAVLSPAVDTFYVNLPANTTGKLTAVKIRPNVVPAWNTPAGSLGSFVKTAFTGIQLSAADPDGAVTYNMVSGSLPAGLTLSAAGLISGSPTATADATASFTVRATGDASDSVDRAFTLTITIPGLAPSDVFAAEKTVLNSTAYTSNSGINLAANGGLVWFKRTDTTTSHVLVDSARGMSSFVSTNTINAQTTAANPLFSFNSNGFTHNVNSNGAALVYWTFREAPKFFDVVTWTGNGANSRQIVHNLGVEPGMILVKAISAAVNWGVYHRSVGNTQYAQMNTSAFSPADANTVFATAPTSTAFTVGRSGLVNDTNVQYVAYVFAHDPSANGVIQCGANVGNGSASSAAINLGWAPRFLLTRAANSADSWALLDTARGIASPGADKYLYAQSNSAENQSDVVDLTANGFVFKNSLNASGANQIYMAIR